MLIKKIDLKNKTKTELEEELHQALREQFNLRMQKGTNPQGVKSHAFKKARRYIAALKMTIHQKTDKL